MQKREEKKKGKRERGRSRSLLQGWLAPESPLVAIAVTIYANL